MDQDLDLDLVAVQEILQVLEEIQEIHKEQVQDQDQAQEIVQPVDNLVQIPEVPEVVLEVETIRVHIQVKLIHQLVFYYSLNAIMKERFLKFVNQRLT